MSDTLVIYIGARRIEVAQMLDDRWQERGELGVDLAQPLPSNESFHPVAEALRRVSALIPPSTSKSAIRVQRRARRLVAVISDRWIATATVPWSDALRAGSSADAYARMFLSAAGYRGQSGDRVVLDDAPAMQPRLAVAYPVTIVAALVEFARGMDAELGSLLPLSVVGWSLLHTRAPVGALAVLEDGSRLIGHGDRRLRGVAVRRQGPSDDEPGSGSAAVFEQWRRMQMRDRHLAAVASLSILDLRSGSGEADALGADESRLSIPLPKAVGAASISPALRLAVTSVHLRLATDGVARRVPLAIAQRTLALIAVVAATVATVQAWRVGSATDTLLEAAAKRPSVIKDVPVGWTQEQLPRVRAVNAAVSDLNMPVLEVISRLVPPRDLPVAILSVDVPLAAQRGGDALRSFKIVAEAESAEDMTRYVSFVSERKRLSSAYLSRHDLASIDAKRPYRFTVEATWTP